MSASQRTDEDQIHNSNYLIYFAAQSFSCFKSSTFLGTANSGFIQLANAKIAGVEKNNNNNNKATNGRTYKGGTACASLYMFITILRS